VTVPSRPGGDSESARRRVTRRLLAFARASFALVGIVPWLIPLARAWLPLGALGLALDSPFVLVCHRLPARTLALAGVTMPVCSRCAGIFGGLFVGAVLAWPRLPLGWARLALAGAGLLMIADVLLQDLGVHPLWHATRLATGLLFGWLASTALFAAIIRERHAPAAAARSPRERS